MNTVHPPEIVGDGSETHKPKFVATIYSHLRVNKKSPEFMNYLNIIMSIIFMNYNTRIQRVKHVSTIRYSSAGMMLAQHYPSVLSTCYFVPRCSVTCTFAILA